MLSLCRPALDLQKTVQMIIFCTKQKDQCENYNPSYLQIHTNTFQNKYFLCPAVKFQLMTTRGQHFTDAAFLQEFLSLT